MKIKKAFILLFILATILFSITTIYAKEVEFTDPITDDTNILDDLDVLGVDISFYTTGTISQKKAYVVAIGENYTLETDTIQTFMYFFIPYNFEDINNVQFKKIDYILEGISNKTHLFEKQSWIDGKNYDSTHHLFKVKGFQLSRFASFEVEITKIQFEDIEYSEPINSGYDADEYISTYESESSFKSNISCTINKENGQTLYSINNYFDMTIVIDDVEVVVVDISEDYKGIINLLSGGEFVGPLSRLLGDYENKGICAYFYNFNIPDNVKIDSIEYAKFELDKYNVSGSGMFSLDSFNNFTTPYKLWKTVYTNKVEERYKPNFYIEKDLEENIIHEVYPGDKTFKIGGNAYESKIENFYIGNRIIDNKLGSIDLESKKVDGDLSSFNMDCSILVDITEYVYQEKPSIHLYYDFEYETLDNIELIELHYKYNGKLFKCQVVSDPVNSKDFNEVNVQPKNEVDDFFQNIFNFFKSNWKSILIIGGIVILCILLAPSVIFYVVKFIAWIFKMLFKILIKIIIFPFKLIKEIVKGIKDRRE